MPDFITIGPECFADGDALVISYKGENYYRSCGEVVHTTRDNATTTHCVKRVDHPSKQHEDYLGNIKELVDGAPSSKLALVENGG